MRTPILREENDKDSSQDAGAMEEPETTTAPLQQLAMRKARSATTLFRTPAEGATAPAAAPAAEEPNRYEAGWASVCATIAGGGTPSADALPPHPKNEVAIRRLQQLQEDQELNADPDLGALRVDFLGQLAARLTGSLDQLKKPPGAENRGLFGVMQSVYWDNPKFQRASKRAPNAARIQETLGTVLRAESYQALMANRKVKKEWYGDEGTGWWAQARAAHPTLPAQPWEPGRGDFAAFQPAVATAPPITLGDLKEDAFLGRPGSSMWVTGTAELASGPGAAPVGQQLALEGDVAERAVIFELPPSVCASAPDPSNPERAAEGSSARRPTALDFMCSDTGGAFNEDPATADFGRTSGGKLEILVPGVLKTQATGSREWAG